MHKPTMPALLLGLAAALAVALIACDRVESQDRTFNLEIEDSKLVAGNPPLQVNEDDYVEITVSSDKPVSFHLHGYDIKVKAGPGQPATLGFTANATGSFPFTIHEDGAEGHTHGVDEPACSSEVPAGAARPEVRFGALPGEERGKVDVELELENFTLVGESADTETLSGHWHLYVDGELAGMFVQPRGTVSIREAGEHQFIVALTDTRHCDYDLRAMEMVTVDAGSADSMDDDAGMGHQEGRNGDDEEAGDGDEREVELGRLEVHPR